VKVIFSNEPHEAREDTEKEEREGKNCLTEPYWDKEDKEDKGDKVEALYQEFCEMLLSPFSLFPVPRSLLRVPFSSQSFMPDFAQPSMKI
jgi:hypothetical protein